MQYERASGVALPRWERERWRAGVRSEFGSDHTHRTVQRWWERAEWSGRHGGGPTKNSAYNSAVAARAAAVLAAEQKTPIVVFSLH